MVLSTAHSDWGFMVNRFRKLFIVCVLALCACSLQLQPAAVGPTRTPVEGSAQVGEADVAGMLDDIRALASLGAHRGWRTAGSPGEAQALDYVAGQLAALAGTTGPALEVTRETFRLPVGSHIHESRLWLEFGAGELEIPADAICCSRRTNEAALFFDSDGRAGDSTPDPAEVSGTPVVIHRTERIEKLEAAGADGQILVVDFALIDSVVQGAEAAGRYARLLLEAKPAAIVLITQFSNVVGESHGTQAAVGSPFTRIASEPWPPILLARLEDLGPAGLASWEALDRLQAVRLRWDVDVFMPGESGNLILHLPGNDPSQAVILGAMIDSANVPGAMDDAAGVAVLLEVARRLTAEGNRLPYDLYLIWFGSEEVGLVGSSYFAASHQELLDRTLAVLTIDCLGSPLDGLTPRLTFGSWPYGVAGEMRLPWVEQLVAYASRDGQAAAASLSGGGSDNMAFVAYDVPNANLVYMNEDQMDAAGGVHYAIHIHDPYDEARLAEKESATLARMFDIAYATALGQVGGMASLRVSPPQAAHALLVGSHTEAVDLPMTTLTSFGITMAMEGFDLDLLPYGEPVTPDALRGVDMAILLPVMDYPAKGIAPEAYDERWSPAEVDAIQVYVEQGGLLIAPASRHQLGWINALWDTNEDWADINAVGERFGVTFTEGVLTAPAAVVAGSSPALGVTSLEMIEGNGLPIIHSAGEVLARAGRAAVVVYIPIGTAGGRIIALSDLGMLGSHSYAAPNVGFWRALARIALDR